MLIATIPLTAFPNLSEGQRERADLGNYAFNQWVRRRIQNPNNAAIPPASHHPSNAPNINRLSDRELYLRQRYQPLIHFMAAQATTPYDENAVRNWNRQLLEFSTPEEDLYFWYNIHPSWGTPRARLAGLRPIQGPTTINHHQPREPTPSRALDIKRLPGGNTTRHTEVVKIRQSAVDPTHFISPRSGYKANDKDEKRLAAQAKSEEDEGEIDEEDEFDPEGDIPSAAACIAPPRNLTDILSTTQNEEYSVYEDLQREDLSGRVKGLSGKVNEAPNEPLASDVSRGRLRWLWDEQHYAGERPQWVAR
ncbi:hypothetical protein N7G274_006568 [Stereocaulon virgatum]|uniref:Uncharacterized protein n=1 Tax=Stereocaulon virgatum TaxID=373712 RepID=A0ABR4A3U3_9LECA